jgi:hypothetical protein
MPVIICPIFLRSTTKYSYRVYVTIHTCTVVASNPAYAQATISCQFHPSPNLTIHLPQIHLKRGPTLSSVFQINYF